MNIDDILKNRQFYESQVFNKVAALERAKVNNTEREKLAVRRDCLAELLSELEQYRRDIRIFGEAVDTEGKLWYQISFDSVNGFIRSDFLEVTQTAEEVEEETVEETVVETVEETVEEPVVEEPVQNQDYEVIYAVELPD